LSRPIVSCDFYFMFCNILPIGKSSGNSLPFSLSAFVTWPAFYHQTGYNMMCYILHWIWKTARNVSNYPFPRSYKESDPRGSMRKAALARLMQTTISTIFHVAVYVECGDHQFWECCVYSRLSSFAIGCCNTKSCPKGEAVLARTLILRSSSKLSFYCYRLTFCNYKFLNLNLPIQ